MPGRGPKNEPSPNNVPETANKLPDVLIIVMGQTGSGKSTFINSAAGEDVIQINRGLPSSPINPIRYADCPHPRESTKIYTLVETPGFNNTDLTAPDETILVNTTKWLTQHFSDIKFGGILYLQQRGQAQPMLTDLLRNDLIKRNLLHVVTTPGPSTGGGGVSGRGDTELDDIREFQDIKGLGHPERKAPAWEIIDEVWSKVEPEGLTVAHFLDELCKIAGVAGTGGNVSRMTALVRWITRGRFSKS